jgi:glutamate-5-semialdehyde dehydrogenase
MDKQAHIEGLCQTVKQAARNLARLSTKERNNILLSIANNLKSQKDKIISENKKDLENGKEAGLSSAMIDRLTLDSERIDGMAQSILEISALSDPIGSIENMLVRPSGIRVGQMRVPVGVIAVIFESRPNVTTDIAALAIKSGNGAILRGGKEAIHSNIVLYNVIADTFKKLGYSESFVELIQDTDRELVPILLKMDKFIDIVVPRGGHGLIKMVSELSTIPVIKHDKGVCHTYVDESADKDMAISIAINAKVQRPGVCNAMETLIIHEKFPYIKELLEALIAASVEIRGCDKTQAILPGKITAAEEQDWDTEYLELILAVKIVSSLDESMDHIYKYSSGHSEAIITNNYANSEKFLCEVDSAAVFVNSSTRFHDGGEFGLGAEVGISTQKLHARGAMGIKGLTCLKYVVYGTGQVR